MTALTLTAQLTATEDPTVRRGLLLPYGEYGYTNKGKVRASSNVLTLAAQLDPLTLEHDRTRPVGHFIGLDEDAAGLWASVRYADTTAGRDAQLEADQGLRAGLSVEIDQPIIRAGELLGGTVTGGSQVAVPAFATARLAASETPDAPDEGTTTDNTADATTTTVAVTEPKEPDMTTPAGLTASHPLTPPGDKPSDLNTLIASLTEFGGSRDSAKLLAALSDITPANILGVDQPQYIGQLWDGAAYERRYLPLWNNKDLTSFEIKGWRWKTKPAVAVYAGGKTDVPSGAVETEPANGEAWRIAGAHDIDRKFRDFQSAEFWNAYFTAMTESYKRVSDMAGLAKVVTASRAVVAGTVPVVNGTALPKGWVSIVDGALSILNATDTMPSYAIVATDLWRDMILMPQDQILAYLTAAVGLQEGSFAGFAVRPSAALAAGKVQMGVRAAVDVYELPGSPIRVDAEVIAKGGVDEGLFGYQGVMIHDTDGLVLVSPKP